MNQDDCDYEDSFEDDDDENLELENEFKTLCNQHRQEIEDKLEEMGKLMTEAIKLSDKYGIPFSDGNQSYFPASFSKKFSDLDQEFVGEITGAYPDYRYDCGDEYPVGWSPSELC